MGVFTSAAGPHFPKFPYEIVRIHTLRIVLDTILWEILKELLYDALRLYQRLRVETSSQLDNTRFIETFQTYSDLPYFRGYATQRGSGFGASAKIVRRRAILF